MNELVPYHHHPELGHLLADPDEIAQAVTNAARIVNNPGMVHIALNNAEGQPHITPMAGVGVDAGMNVVFWSYEDSPHTQFLLETARSMGTVAMTVMLHHKYLEPHEAGEMDTGYIRMLGMRPAELGRQGILRYLGEFNAGRRRSHYEQRDLDEFIMPNGEFTRKRLYIVKPALTDERRDVGVTYPISAYAAGDHPKQFHVQHPLTPEEIWARAQQLRARS
ncbi:MAG TPA: pyridoxamine 5'-phosphate oxidase family protein [Candidatus Saccharimonadales bacterium]|nr:pyridoxamine 5'-phosphate oxidase family protein [Candidatus Saccharimonadales bacterium]